MERNNEDGFSKPKIQIEEQKNRLQLLDMKTNKIKLQQKCKYYKRILEIILSINMKFK